VPPAELLGLGDSCHVIARVHFDADVVPFLHVSFLSSSRSATRNVQICPLFFRLDTHRLLAQVHVLYGGYAGYALTG
jgi:hypothetical protein